MSARDRGQSLQLGALGVDLEQVDLLFAVEDLIEHVDDVAALDADVLVAGDADPAVATGGLDGELDGASPCRHRHLRELVA